MISFFLDLPAKYLSYYFVRTLFGYDEVRKIGFQHHADIICYHKEIRRIIRCSQACKHAAQLRMPQSPFTTEFNKIRPADQ